MKLLIFSIMSKVKIQVSKYAQCLLVINLLVNNQIRKDIINVERAKYHISSFLFSFSLCVAQCERDSRSSSKRGSKQKTEQEHVRKSKNINMTSKSLLFFPRLHFWKDWSHRCAQPSSDERMASGTKSGVRVEEVSAPFPSFAFCCSF